MEEVVQRAKCGTRDEQEQGTTQPRACWNLPQWGGHLCRGQGGSRATGDADCQRRRVGPNPGSGRGWFQAAALQSPGPAPGVWLAHPLIPNKQKQAEAGVRQVRPRTPKALWLPPLSLYCRSPVLVWPSDVALVDVLMAASQGTFS